MSSLITRDLRSPGDRSHSLKLSPLGPASTDATEVTSWLFEELAWVWLDFSAHLAADGVVQRVEDGTVTLHDYCSLLLNLRQQVMEGGRWIALAASSMPIKLFAVRSLLIRHAAEEHTDYQMLEHDYCSVGGSLETIQTQVQLP